MPNDGFVLYNVGKDLYRVADKDVKAFESENPDASIKYSTDDYDFDIPLSQREEFLKDVPNATFSQYDDKQWQKSKGKDWAPSKYAGLSYDELLKIRDDQRLDAEPFISEYEEKAKKSLHWRGSAVPADAKWLTENKARYDAAKADVTDLARSIKAAPEYKAVREGATDAIKAQKQIIDTAEEEVYQDAQRAFDAQRANMTTKDRIVKAFGSGSNEADPFGEYDPNTYRGWINTEGYEGFGSNIDNYEAAKNILSNAEKTLKSVTKTDVKAAGDKKLDVIMKGVGQGIGQYVSDLDSWSAILGAKHALPVYALQQKLDTIFRGMGEDITLEEMDKRISDGLTPSEQALFYAIETAGGISAALDKEIHGSVKAGESMAMSARMGLEFLLLSGMSGAANATVARNIEKRLARKLITKETPKAARKVISSLIKVGAEDTGALVGGGIQTALGPSNWAQVAKNVQNNYQQFIASNSNSLKPLLDPEVRAAKGIDTPTLGGLTLEGLVQQLIENATEFGFGPTNKAIRYLQRAGYKGFSKLGWNRIASLLTPQAAATLKKMGISPLGEEFGEEVNGALISWVRGTERDDEGRNVALKNFFDAENLAILFATFVPTIGFGSVVSAAQRGAANVRFDEARTAYRNYLISNGVAEDKATNIVDSLNGATPEELGRRAARLLDNARTSSAPGKETEAGLILNLLEAARDKSALDGVASIKRNADRDNTFDEILGNTNKQFWQTREEDAEDEFGNQYKEDVQFVDVLTTNGENNFFIRKEDENGNVETIDENGTIRRFTAAEVEQGLADGTFTGRRQMDMADYLDERNGVKEDAVWEVSAERTSQMAAYDAGNQTGQNHKAMQESAYDTAQNLESARLAAIEAGVPEDDLRLGSDVLARQAFEERQAGNTELATALDNYATAKAAYDGLKEGYIASRVQRGRNEAESYIKAFGRNDRIISGMYTDAKGEMHEGYILSEDVAIARDGSVTVIGGTGDSMVQVSDGKGGVVLIPASQLSAYSTTFDEYRNEFEAASRQWAENAFAEAESRPSRTAMSNDIAPLVGRTILVNGQDGAVGSMTIVSVNTDAGTVTFKDKSGGGAQNTISIDTLYGMAQRDAEGHIVLDPTATENKPIIEAAQQQAEASASEEAETPQAPQLRVGDEVPVVFEGQPANAMVTGIDNDGSITFSILNEAGEDVRAGRVSGQEFANMMNAASTPAPAAPAQSPTPAPSPTPEPAPAATRLTPEQEYENVFSDDNFETEDEAYGFVKGKVKRAKEAADKAQAAVDKIKPEDFDTSQAYRTAKDKAKKDAEPAIADYEHWKAVKDLADAARQAEKERQERLARMEERALMEPHGMREVVANAFSANHSLDREDFKRETGLSDAELRRFFPFWAKKGTGMTVKAFAESIAASDDTGLLPRDGETGAVDINAIRSEIIDLILSSQSPRDIMDYTRNENIRRREEAERYAEGAPEDLPMTPEEAEAEKQQPFIDRIREWEQRTGVRVNAISQEQDVTEQQAREAIQQGRKITGWFNKFNGSVEIYLPNITSMSEIDATFMHEVISHKGLRELFKEVDADGNVSYEKYNRLLDAVWNDIMTEADRQKYIDYVNRGGEQFENEDARRRAAADEYIAYFSETLNPDVNPTGWEKFVELVKSLLDSMGFKITKEDLSRILYSSLANFEKNRFEEQPVRESTGNGSDFAAPFDEDALGFREVTDPAKIAELEAGEKVIGYRTVVLNEDGTLSSPMAGRLGEVNSKKGEKQSAATSSFSFGKWEEAEENPSLADENGKIRLIKPKTRKVKLTDVDKVDYNPYVHLRLDKINRQFKDAWKRPDLVYISSEVPASEVNNPDPYHAEKAALPVGIHDWNGGALMLSRYDKPQAQVPWEEVADAWAADEEFQKNGVNFDIVPPQILSMLQERGIEILPPHNGMGEACNKAYNAWKVGDLLSYRSWRDLGKGLLGRKLSMDEIAKKYEINKEYLEAVEAGDMAKAQDIVDQAAQAAGYTVKAFHGSLSKDITRFDKDKIGSRYAYDERGFFFTSSPTIAGYYASSEFDSSRKGKVYPVFLRLQNPLVVDAKFARKEGLGRRFSDMDAIEVWDNYQSFLLDKVDEGGNDGVLINDGQTQMYVVFDANQIKSAEPVTRDDNGKVIPLSERFNERSNDLRFREANENQEIFVSNAAKALEGISQDKATPEQWLKMIESKGGLKAGEDKWIGLTDWIKSRRRKTLTKQEIEDYINEHKIQIEEGEEISGEGLRIGAEGMSGFYDQILPRFMDKYGKKWGVKTEDITLSDVYDEVGHPLVMHSVKVTPEMKRSVREGQLMFRETFHGTGADFDRFDHSHMGEGEGGQMYGWGTYVTTNKDTGLAYARSIGGSDEQYERAVRSIENQIDSDNAKLKKAQTGEERKALEDDIALMEQRKEEMKRHLYTVEIPDDNGQNYLHWDRPLTIEQVRKIQQAVRERVGDEWGEEFEYELQSALGYGTYGRHVEGGLDYFLGDQKDYATGKDPGAERNSKLLKSLGIVGMEIPIDRQGGQRYEGSNFVIFDESDLEIKDHLRFRESENNSNFVDNGKENTDTPERDSARGGNNGGGVSEKVRRSPRRQADNDRSHIQRYRDGLLAAEQTSDRDDSSRGIRPDKAAEKAIQAKLDQVELDATHKMLDSMESEFGIKINRVSRNEMRKGHETNKGYYDTATGEVTICMDNVANMDDAMATVLHESVGHLGLRRLLGSRFNDAMRDIYDHLDREGKNWVNRYIASHDLKPGDPGITEGVEEYLSHLAESGDFKNSVWDEIKQIICDVIDAIFGTDGFTLTDNELNYILRASYENLKDPNWLNTLEGQAKDMALKYQLGINETDPSRPTDPDGGIRFRESSGVARDDFEQDMRGWWNNTVTEHQNKYLPVKLAVKRVMEEVGKKELNEAEDFEAMAVLSSSRAQTEQQEFEMFFFSPILDQVRKIRDRIAGKRASKTERTTAYHEVLDYLYRVSGLERNEYKNNEIEQAKIEAVNNLRADAQARKDAIDNDANLSDAEKAARKDAIDAEVSTRVPEIEAEYESRKKDWSGLSSLEEEVDQKALDNLRPLPTDTPKEISRKQAQEADLRRQWWQNAEAKARAAVDDFRSRVGDDAMLTELWDNIRKATDYNLKHALDHGLLTQEEYDRLHGTDTTPRMWNYYLPLRGFAEETAEDVYDYSSFTSSPANGVVVKKMGGRWTEADNPLANILNIAETEIAQGNANMAKQALYRFALNAGENTLLSVRDAWYVKDPTTGKWTVAEVQINPATGKEETLEEFEARMEGLRKSKDQDGKPLARKGRRGLKLDHILRNSGHKGEHIIRLKVAGQEKVIWVNGNPAVAQAVNGVQRAKAWGWLRNASRALSNLFTTYSLDFSARNLIRDTMYSRMGLMVKENRAYRQQYRKNWWNNFGYGAFAFPMVRMMVQWESGRLQQKANPSRKEQMFMDFMRDGGATGYTIINSVDTIKRDLERAMRRSGEKGRKIRIPILGHYAAAVKTLNEGFELLTRFTAYQTSRQMGRSGQRSALDAKEISVNFNRQGAQSGKGGFMGALAAYMGATHYFYNAGVQGFDNFLRLFKAAPVKMTGSMAGLSLLGMMTPIINSAIAGLVSGLGGDDDDDKRDQWYWELPQWVRRNNIVLGWPGFYVTIPLPPEFRAFYGLGDIAASFMYDKVTGNNGFAVAGDILNTAAGVLPVNPIENFNSNGNVGVPEGVLRTFFPDAGMFIVDLATNRDFTGKPLAKENPYYDTTPASQAVYASDPEYLVKATQWLAQQTAGTPVYVDLNAGKLRDIFKNFGGGFYNTAEDVAKIFMADEKHPLRRDNIPFFSGFTGHLDEDRANNFENSALREYKDISERVVRRISSAIGDKVSPADVYNNPENLPQEGRVQALLEGKDYQLGKMYHDGMNNRKEIIPGGAVYKSGKKKGQPKPETIPGVNKLRQNWKDMQDAYFAMPEGDEKEAFKLQVQDAFNKYHDAEGNLCDKLLEYENENAFLRLHWDKAQRRVYEDMKSLVR